MEKKHVFIGDIDCGSDRLFLIAGPCVIEEESLMMRTAERLKKNRQRLEVPLIFKSSFSKDNRSSLEYYQGPGLEAGLTAAREGEARVRSADPHGHSLSVSGCSRRRKCATCIQIPAYLCMQSELVVAAAKTGARRQHQARPVLGAREHGEARQEDRGLRQRSHHRDGARLHVRLQRPRRGSAQLLLARIRSVTPSCSTRGTRSASTEFPARTRAAALGSS